MFRRQYAWLMTTMAATMLVGCVDGGRGSSGFDISENAAIRLVLDTQECVEGSSLTLCPADQAMMASPTPTVAPPDPTATPGGTQRIDTGLANGASITCVHSSPTEACRVEFAFAAIGFPSTSVFRVASRLQAPSTAWTLAPPPVPVAGTPSAQATIVTFDVPANGVTARLQFAVLVYPSEPVSIPATFDVLADSKAPIAFVTDELVLDVVLVEATPTPTGDETPTPTPFPPTPTPTLGEPLAGPVLTYFGVTRADNLPLAPTAFDAAGRPIYVRPFGSGLSLIIEGRPGTSARRVGPSAYNPSGLPDLQVILSNAIGDGSTAVCDRMPADPGGVPGTSPFSFADPDAIVAAVNDLGCRVDNGAGLPEGRTAENACTTRRGGDYAFVDTSTTLQFCLPIASAWAFPVGDTIVAARLRDTSGNLGAVREIIIRVGSSGAATPTPIGSGFSPTPTRSGVPAQSVTPSPTPTPTGEGRGPLITHFGLARADSSPLAPEGTDASGRAIYHARQGSGMSIVVEARPGAARRPPGVSAYSDVGVPDLQMILSRGLGDSSTAICDNAAPTLGGVPATVPFAFGDGAAVTAAINDLGCRVNDGTGRPVARLTSSDACTSSNDGGPSGYAFVDSTTTAQYCLPIALPWAFPPGDTIIAVRVRDQGGNVGEVKEIVVRVDDPPHPFCDGEERIFSLTRAGSALRTTAAQGPDVTFGPWESDPIVICVGEEDENGHRQLKLRNEATIAMRLTDSSLFCVRLDPDRSIGDLACRGGAAHDIALAQNSHGAGAFDARRLETHVGSDSGAGAASLSIALGLALLPPGSSTDACRVRSYPAPDYMAMTTADASVVVEEPVQGGQVAIEAEGEPFDCAHILEEDSAGTFVLPFVGLDTPLGDTANVLVLSD